jgi:hypothetical protein
MLQLDGRLGIPMTVAMVAPLKLSQPKDFG